MSDYICEELIAEIFERLPVKSLVRFRCLSKSWCCRISSPEFIRMHTLRSVKSSPQKVIIIHEAYNKFEAVGRILTLHSQDQLPMCGYSGIPMYEINDCRIIGSCNGIICLLDYKNKIINLWNPSINRIFSLPPHFSLKVRLVTEFGFGYDPMTNDYKIVKISGTGKVILDSFVYSMKTGTWCEIALPTIPFPYTVSSKSCFVNGALHWLCYTNSGCIITFDLSTHVIGTIALPEMNSSWKATSLTVFRGSLAIITGDHNDHNQCIWMMKEYKNVASWCMAFGFTSSNYRSEGGLHTIFELANGDFLYKTTYGMFNVYNIPSSRVLYTLADELTYRYEKAFFLTFVDSLALLDTGFPSSS